MGTALYDSAIVIQIVTVEVPVNQVFKAILNVWQISLLSLWIS